MGMVAIYERESNLNNGRRRMEIIRPAPCNFSNCASLMQPFEAQIAVEFIYTKPR
mgnify:FL=1